MTPVSFVFSTFSGRVCARIGPTDTLADWSPLTEAHARDLSFDLHTEAALGNPVAAQSAASLLLAIVELEKDLEAQRARASRPLFRTHPTTGNDR